MTDNDRATLFAMSFGSPWDRMCSGRPFEAEVLLDTGEWVRIVTTAMHYGISSDLVSRIVTIDGITRDASVRAVRHVRVLDMDTLETIVNDDDNL